MVDEGPERETDALIEALGWVDSYVRYLRDLGMPRELVARRERQLRVMATVCVQQTGHGLEEIAVPEAGKSPAWPGGNPMGRLREAFQLLDDVGLEEGEPAWCTQGNVRVCMDSLRAFLAWRHRGEPEGPTAERLAELERLRGYRGAKLPVSDEVRKLLAAPGRETTAGRTDTVAMTLAAHEGLSAEDLCALRVGDVDLDGRRLRVRPGHSTADGAGDGDATAGGDDRRSTGTSGATAEQDHGTETTGATVRASAPVRSVALDDWWVKLLGPLVEGEAPERPLLRSRTGEALTPRRLQQRVAERVKALGDELSEPLTLERLRDYAGYQMLVGGRDAGRGGQTAGLHADVMGAATVRRGGVGVPCGPGRRLVFAGGSGGGRGDRGR
jgi:integrase